MSDPIIEAVAELLSEFRAELQAQLDESAATLKAQKAALDCLQTRLEKVTGDPLLAVPQSVKEIVKRFESMEGNVLAAGERLDALGETLETKITCLDGSVDVALRRHSSRMDEMAGRMDAIDSTTAQTVEGALQSVFSMLDQVTAQARTMKELVEARANDVRDSIGDLEECDAKRIASIAKLGERIDAISDRIDDTEIGVLERVEARLQQSDAQVQRLAGLVDGLRTAVNREVRDGRDGEFPPPVPWEAGKAYPQGALVTARGGLFYAKRNTDQDIDGATWLPLARGVDRVEVEHDPDGDDPRTVEIVVTLSDGTSTRTATRLPLPLHLGKWLAERHYKFADEVAWNGSTWRAARRSLNETPGTSDAWLLVAKSGLRAGKGAA